MDQAVLVRTLYQFPNGYRLSNKENVLCQFLFNRHIS